MNLYKRPVKNNNHLTVLFKSESGGVALVLVIWIMVMLLAIVGEFAYSMRTEVNITRNLKEEEEAYHLAVAGIEQAKAEILSVSKPAYTYMNEDGDLLFVQEEEEPVRSGELGKGNFKYTITDEDGKLNINRASLNDLRNLLMNTGVEFTEVDTIVDSIIDWRDVNDLHMLNGAEEDYYRSLPVPYSCKDGPFDILEELLLVKGMTEEIYYGSEDREGEGEYTGVVNHLTVSGSNTVNINTAPFIVLEAIFGNTPASNIVSQREAEPILRPIKRGKVSSEIFTIISTGINIDGTIKRSIKTVVKKKTEGLETLYWNDNFIG
jgi:general secretion pathway protein K